MTRRSRLLALAVAVLAVSTALPAWAQTDPSEVSGNEMADGPWTGSFTAAGVQTYAEGGVTATVTIEDSGTFSFTVAGGSTSGTWSSAGTNIWHTDPGQPAMLTGTSNLISSGSITGGRTSLTGTGSTSQSGTLYIESSGRTITRPISSNTSLTFSMTVTGASCEAAHGVLAGSFIRGTFTAVNDASFEELLFDEDAAALIGGLTNFLDLFSSFMGSLAERTSSYGIPARELMDLMADAEAVLNELRNVSSCLSLQVGADRIEQWNNMITADVAKAITGSVHISAMSVGDVRALINAGLRMGALGSGATDQVNAAAAEEEMRRRIEIIVNSQVRFDDICTGESGACLLFTPDVIDAVVLGNQMNWSFDLETPDGTNMGTFAASDLLEIASGNQ